MDRRRPLKLAALVFVASLALRVTWVAFSQVTPVSDFKGYHDMAVRWLQEGEFGQPGSYAYRTPGYPGFLALTYLLAGPNPRAAGFAQALLGAFTSGLLVMLAAHLLSPRAAVIAGLLHALSPTALAYVPVLASETLTAFLLVLTLCCLSLADHRGREARLWLAAGGLLSGLLVLVRPAACFFLPAGLLLASYSFRHSAWRRAGGVLFLVCLLATLSPWVIRNRILGLGPFTISTVGGENLWMGNNDLARLGGFCPEAAWPVRPGETERGRDLRYRAAARRWVLSHPRQYARLCLIRAYRLLGVEPDTWAAKYLWPTRESDAAFVAREHYQPTDPRAPLPDLVRRAGEIETRHAIWLRRLRLVAAPLILLSVVVALPWWRDYAIVLFPAFSYLAGLSLTYVEIRFRELADPLLMVPLAGLLAMLIFRRTELAVDSARPSWALDAVVTTMKALAPDFRPAEIRPRAPVSRAEAEASLRAAQEATASCSFSPIPLITQHPSPVALWSAPTWSVSVSRREDGVRCLVQASSESATPQRGGLLFPVPSCRALRIDLTFLRPHHIQLVEVEGCDRAGATRIKWRWPVFPDSLPPRGRTSYVLIPGRASYYFLPEGEPEPTGVVEIRVWVGLPPSACAGFILHRAEMVQEGLPRPPARPGQAAGLGDVPPS